MNRLIEKTVFSGLVMACRFATCPTRISPSFVNPTTDGVSRLPSWFAITVGLPPSTTETTELVVPRSMPMTFAITVWLHFFRPAGRASVDHGGGGGGPPPPPPPQRGCFFFFLVFVFFPLGV